MTKNQQQTIAIAVGIVLAVFIGAYVLVIGPQWKASKAASAEAADLSLQVADSQAQAASLRAQAANLDTTVDQMDQLFRQFPNQIDQQQLLALVIDAAEEAEIDLRDIAPGIPGDPAIVNTTSGGQTGAVGAGVPVTAASSVGEYPVAVSQLSITAIGEIPNQRKFLSILETLERPLTIRNVAVRGTQLTLVARAYITRPLPLPNEDGSTSASQDVAPAPEADPNATPPVPGVPAG